MFPPPAPPARSPEVRHRIELAERDWENAVQGFGKEIFMFAHLNSYSLQRTKLLGTAIHMRVLLGGESKGGRVGRGGSGVGKAKEISHRTADR